MIDDDDNNSIINGGAFYGQRRPGGRLERLATDPSAGQPVDAWICRRVADYPRGAVPAGAAVAHCTRCGALIAFNPKRVASVPPDTPQVCMQCAGIEPLPYEERH